jgi:opacity protein-like surface antigen
MFNAIYTFDDVGGNAAFQPYVGAGIGGADLETSMYDGTWSADTVFAYQFIGGVGYQVAPQWTLFGEARYFGTQGSEFDGPDGFNFDAGFDTIDLLVGAKLSF